MSKDILNSIEPTTSKKVEVFCFAMGLMDCPSELAKLSPKGLSTEERVGWVYGYACSVIESLNAYNAKARSAEAVEYLKVQFNGQKLVSAFHSGFKAHGDALKVIG
jgi:hypothetical protein